MKALLLMPAAILGLVACDDSHPGYGKRYGIPVATRVVDTPRDWVVEFIDPKSGCRMLIHHRSAPVVAPKRNGRPDCPEAD